MKTDHDFHRPRRHPRGQHTYQHNRDDRDVIEAREDPNDLPQPLRSKLQ